jgi:hypothetical protein
VELKRLALTHTDAFRNGVLVIDGPVGSSIDADPTRLVDALFACEGFFNRAPGYRITQGSGLELSTSTARILRTLVELLPVRPWLGGPLPEDGLVVAETNPTPAMALLLPQQEISMLPSRAQSKYLDGTAIRAKSDWYWRLGAGSYAARVLGVPTIADERNHERVAGLFALALATAMADDPDDSAVVALGDENGVYVVSSDIDETWAADVRRVGVASGTPRFGRGVVGVPPSTGAAVREVQVLDVAGLSDDKSIPIDSLDSVTVVLNDNGGLNMLANPWLEGVDIPCCLVGSNGISFTVEATFSTRDDMFKVGRPNSTLKIAKHLGFAGDHLSKVTPVVFEAAIIDCK